jgi:hypothetical protein
MLSDTIKTEDLRLKYTLHPITRHSRRHPLEKSLLNSYFETSARRAVAVAVESQNPTCRLLDRTQFAGRPGPPLRLYRCTVQMVVLGTCSGSTYSMYRTAVPAVPVRQYGDACIVQSLATELRSGPRTDPAARDRGERRRDAGWGVQL